MSFSPAGSTITSQARILWIFDRLGPKTPTNMGMGFEHLLVSDITLHDIELEKAGIGRNGFSSCAGTKLNGVAER